MTVKLARKSVMNEKDSLMSFGGLYQDIDQVVTLIGYSKTIRETACISPASLFVVCGKVVMKHENSTSAVLAVYFPITQFVFLR